MSKMTTEQINQVLAKCKTGEEIIAIHSAVNYLRIKAIKEKEQAPQKAVDFTNGQKLLLVEDQWYLCTPIEGVKK